MENRIHVHRGIVDTIEIAGLSIPLEQTPSGPIMSVEDQRLAPLAWVVNSALTEGSARGLADALERGSDLIVQGLYATRPEPDDPLVDDARRNWRELSGSDAGEDVYVVGTTFCSNEFVIPRSALKEILTTLKTLHQQTPLAPVPWLFRPYPIYPDPGEGEEEIVRHLESEAEKLESLIKEAAETGDPPQELLATISAKRRFLISGLASAGLLHEAYASNKRYWLVAWRASLVLAYYEAALELLTYSGSSDRKYNIPDAGPEPVEGARVSLDWFRFPQKPPVGFTRFEWLAYCESIFMNISSSNSDEGDVFIHEGQLRYQLYWRKDDGITPALVSAVPL